MKNAFPWIIAGVGAGIATYLLLREQNGPRYAAASAYDAGYDAVNNAAARTDAWGIRQRVAGAGSSVLGKVKEGVGRMTGNDRLATEGALDDAAGQLRNATGTAANAASQTLRDLNL